MLSKNVVFKFLFYMIVVPLIGLFGSGMLTQSWLYYKERASSWPMALGRVKNIKTATHYRRIEPYTVWHVDYVYQVHDKKFENDRIAFDRIGSGDSMDADYLSDPQLKVGDKISVYYNPSNPKESVTDTRPPWCNFVKLFQIGFLTMVMAILGALRNSQKPSPLWEDEVD